MLKRGKIGVCQGGRCTNVTLKSEQRLSLEDDDGAQRNAELHV